MSRTLRQGNTGADVQNLQRLLNFHGCNLVPDGVFGPLTLKCVLKVQKAASIEQDGVVGNDTKLALFPSLDIESAFCVAPRGASPGPLLALASAQSPVVSTIRSNVQAAAPAAPPVTAGQSPPAPPTIKFQNLTVQGGTGFAWSPYVQSPLVLAASGTFVLRWSDIGWNGLKMTGGIQYAQNTLNSANGNWTGQGSIQLQPTSPWLDKNLKFFDERLDLTSVFIQGFVQKNQNSAAWQSGVGLGWQPSVALVKGTGDDPVLTLWINTAVVKAWDLSNGQGQPVSPQITGGLSLDLWQLLTQQKK